MSISTSTLFYRIQDYIHYTIHAGNEHDVHSPFVFKLLTESLYKKVNDASISNIEKLRKELKQNHSVIQTTDLGAGSQFDGKLHSRRVSDIIKKFAKPPKFCRFLYKCVNHLQPEIMVELGTSLGISALYQSAGNPTGKLYTLEGCQETAKIARENFHKLSYNQIECITGHFDSTLPELLSRINKVDYVFIDGNHTYNATIHYFKLIKQHHNKNTFIIFDDINWSAGMKKAWEEIKKDKDVTITIDFFAMGMVFFNPDFSKQDFLLKLR